MTGIWHYFCSNPGQDLYVKTKASDAPDGLHADDLAYSLAFCLVGTIIARLKGLSWTLQHPTLLSQVLSALLGLAATLRPLNEIADQKYMQRCSSFDSLCCVTARSQ